MSNQVKFPHVKVKLVGQDGNAFAILARVITAMRRAKVPAEAISEYQTAATSGDYNHLLMVTTQTVNVS